MHPTITSVIAAERSQDLLRRARRVGLAEPPIGDGRSPRFRHPLSGSLRRQLRRVSFAR